MTTSEVTIAITSICSGSFALLGVGLSNRLGRQRDQAAFRAETALELAGMERLVWGDSWIELQAHIQRQQSRLIIAGVPGELVTALGLISVACWQDLRAHVERPDGVAAGIRRELLAARTTVHGSARAELLCEGSRASRRQMRTTALRSVEMALANSEPVAWHMSLPSPYDEACETLVGRVRRR
jgi:hypothetical protein